MKKRVAILEIGGSHDECILSQLIGLKHAGATIYFCSTKAMIDRNPHFHNYVDHFYEVKLPQKAIGDFLVMKNLNKWFVKNKIEVVVCNTAQGGHIRNLTLTSPKRIKFFGIIHTIKMLDGRFTQKLISLKIKDYFILNDTLIERSMKSKGIQLHSFYPLDFPHFNFQTEKPETDFWIAIIGGVENRRKDLTGLIDIIRNTPNNVKFHLLGKSDKAHPEVLAFLNQLKQYQLEDRVVWFDRFLSQEEFDGYLQNADAILPLVHPNTPSADEYFNRQISGAINVAFAYKVPMMIHEAYANWEDFRSGVVFYNATNFDEQWKSFQQNIKKLKSELESNPKFNSTIQNQQFAKIVLA